jgi:hypothetical protein
MKKPILIAVVAGGLAFASAPRSDAQLYFSVGFGPGYRALPVRLLLPAPLITGRTTGPTIGLSIGTAGIATTVTSGIITVIGTKLP